VAKAQVRGRELSRHAAVRYDSGKTYGTSCALGLPRLWSYVTTSALDGLGKGLDADRSNGADRLVKAFLAAREHLVTRCEMLIEHIIPDATLTSVMLGDGELHVVSAGPGRVYLHRRGEPRRLTPREDEPEGLLRAQPVRTSVPLEPGDLVLCGSISAFSMRAIARVASVLEEDPKTPPAVLASLLTEPAATAGVGAAAVVLRIL
jgi:hypothetical protein